MFSTASGKPSRASRTPRGSIDERAHPLASRGRDRCRVVRLRRHRDNTALFTILHPVAKPVEDIMGHRFDEWALCTTFPGSTDQVRYGGRDDGAQDRLKAEAEWWPEEFTAYPRRVFPGVPGGGRAVRNTRMAGHGLKSEGLPPLWPHRDRVRARLPGSRAEGPGNV